MKHILLIILITISAGAMNAQTVKKCIFSQKNERSHHLNVKKVMSCFKKESKKDSGFSLFHSGTFRPKLSVDLLDGGGIHILNTPEIGPIRSMSVGARFKAGIIITI